MAKIKAHAKRLRIYIGEADSWEGKSLYKALVLKAKELVASRFKHVCGGSTTVKKDYTADSTASIDIAGLPHSCQRLQGACHRVFSSTLAGQ